MFASSNLQIPLFDDSLQNPDRKKAIQHHLILLLHAHKCANRLNSYQCQLPFCSTMKQVLQHLMDCRSERDCSYNYCTASRRIIEHWRTCRKDDCIVCKDLRRERPKDSSLALPVSSGNSSQYNPGAMRTWHNDCADHVRAYVVSKIEKDIQTFLSPNRWGTLRSVAERIERESYETAQSKEGYFLAIAQKVFAASRQSRASMVTSKMRQRWRRTTKKQQTQQPTKSDEKRKSVIFECVICLEDFRHSRRRKQTLNCKHVFHTTCIKKWLSRSPACPLCRAPGS